MKDPTANQPRFFNGVDGFRIAYRRWGKHTGKPALLCLSGTTRTSLDFVDLGKAFSDDRLVLAMDWRGCGQSGRSTDWTSYMPVKLLHDALALCVIEDVRRAIIVGTSLGGAIGMALAVARPSLMAGLVLNDIGPVIKSDGLGRIWDVIGKTHFVSDWGEAERWCRQHFPPLNLSEIEWRRMAENTFVASEEGRLKTSWDPLIATTQQKMTQQNTDLMPLFRATFRVPTCLFHGECSDILSIEAAQQMAEIHPRLSAHLVPDCGHAPNLSEPILLEKLHDFIKQCDPADG